MSTLLLFSVCLPALLAVPLAMGGSGGRLALRLAPWSPLPALLIAAWPGGVDGSTLPWLLEGSRWGLDPTGQVFLLLTSFLWLMAGLYARRYFEGKSTRRFFTFHLLTLTGNLGIAAAQDLISFYLFFALMTFAGYGLVVHTGTGPALRAGRVYLVMAVMGEALLISGLILAASSAASLALGDVAAAVGASPHRDLVIGLLLAGFGVKAGALPLHMWLPLAHPVAPTPASAVLSGSMIKAGLLGWLRFLPFGVVALPGWGILLIVLGILAAFFGVLVGVTQRDAKTALAYSSISQMGIINVAVGIGLASPGGAASAIAACTAFAVHHGLAKGALFLGAGVAAVAGGVRQRRWAFFGLLVPALAVAGAPLTSGAVAKNHLKEVVELAPAWPQALEWLLAITSIGTTLLMARFLVLAFRDVQQEEHLPVPRGLWLPWAILIGGVVGVLWVLPHLYELELEAPGIPYPGAIWVSLWPVVAGLLVVWLGLIASRRLRLDTERFHVVPGDLLHFVESGLGRIRSSLSGQPAESPVRPVVSLGSTWYGIYRSSERQDRALRMEVALTAWRSAALLFVVVILVLFVLLAVAGASGR